MRILIDGRLISNKETGISRYSKEILKIYIDIFGAEKITVILNPKIAPIIARQFKGIKIFETKYYPFNIIDFLKFHKKLSYIDFDIYHSLFYSNSYFKVKGKIYITTVHDLMFKIVPNFFCKNSILNSVAVSYFDFIVRRSLNNSDYIISVSGTTQKDIRKIYNLDSIVIPEGTNELKYCKKELQINLDIIRPKEYFLYVGNNRPHKNVKFLINCYLKSKTSKALVIVGHKGRNISSPKKKVLYYGYVNDFTLRFLYKNCSAFIYPSLYEGFGLPVLEAINMDAIVFSSTGGALKEFGNYNIFYFNPRKESELIYLIENVDKFSFDYKKKEKLLSKYSWEVTKRKMRQLYERTLDGST